MLNSTILHVTVVYDDEATGETAIGDAVEPPPTWMGFGTPPAPSSATRPPGQSATSRVRMVLARAAIWPR